ncbi:hypothetical protein [Reyranella sp.]|uniref:hypothetical protein n=1 Tax=Reyranella sp. TaxID=1929291 RepID=UPI003D0B6DCB
MVTYALTVWQPWASLIVEGIKPFEFRGWCTPDRVIGKRLVIHAARRPVRASEIRQAMESLHRGHDDGMKIGPALDLLEAVWRRDRELPLGAGLGTAMLGPAIECSVLFRDDADVDPDKWGWPLDDVRHWPAPVPMAGAQGFWKWPHPLGAGA